MEKINVDATMKKYDHSAEFNQSASSVTPEHVSEKKSHIMSNFIGGAQEQGGVGRHTSAQIVQRLLIRKQRLSTTRSVFKHVCRSGARDGIVLSGSCFSLLSRDG